MSGDQAASTTAFTPVADLTMRASGRVKGRIAAVEVSPHDGVSQLIITVSDPTGSVRCVFLGRRHITGLGPGQTIIVEGVTTESAAGPIMFNPRYDLCAA